jgi:hypothetical protein
MKLPPALTKVLDKSYDLLGDNIRAKFGQTNKGLETQRPNIVEDENLVDC